MIKFKEFDVGDIRYEEQIEKFQKEHQNAEFIQITGGYTSYEKFGSNMTIVLSDQNSTKISRLCLIG